jgi:fatty-acyl-CoA synthase
VARRVTDAVGVPPAAVVAVAPGTLPKTSSGKLRRAATRSVLADRLLRHSEDSA